MNWLASYLKETEESERSLAAISFLAALDHIKSTSPQVANAIAQELKDQRSHLKLIASENYSSLAVQLAMGNLLTDKYAEGFPHHRFYAGCENVDTLEELAQEHLKELFGCDHAYVQPHSGADANMVAYWTILAQRIELPTLQRLEKKNVELLSAAEHETMRQQMLQLKLLGMSLNSGGHLTHGYRHNLSSKMMQAFSYEVDRETELLDYKALQEQAKQIRPDILIAGFSAYPRRLNFAKFKEIADSVGAVLLVDMAHFAGLVAGKAFEGEYNPVPYADIVTSTTHKTLRGPRGGIILCKQKYAEQVNKACPRVLGGPLAHVIGAKVIAFEEALKPSFRTYAKKIIENAQALAQNLSEKGIRVVTGGTDNHLVIIDLSALGITGRQGEIALRLAGLTVNRNAIPYDAKGPWYTSGLRIGTPAVTTLGMGKEEMKEIADIIYYVLSQTTALQEGEKKSLAQPVTPPAVTEAAKSRVKNLLQNFPLYPEIKIDL